MVKRSLGRMCHRPKVMYKRKLNTQNEIRIYKFYNRNDCSQHSYMELSEALGYDLDFGVCGCFSWHGALIADEQDIELVLKIARPTAVQLRRRLGDDQDVSKVVESGVAKALGQYMGNEPIHIDIFQEPWISTCHYGLFRDTPEIEEELEIEQNRSHKRNFELIRGKGENL